MKSGKDASSVEPERPYDFFSTPVQNTAYDFRRFTVFNHEEVDDFYGPIEVRQAGNGRGRGLFLTRDVECGELLFAEKCMASSISGNSASPGSQSMTNIFLVSFGTLLKNLINVTFNDSRKNSILSYMSSKRLGGDKSLDSDCIEVNALRSGSALPICPPLSSAMISAIIETNAFTYAIPVEYSQIESDCLHVAMTIPFENGAVTANPKAVSSIMEAVLFGREIDGSRVESVRKVIASMDPEKVSSLPVAHF
jgi:hypothetical protein